MPKVMKLADKTGVERILEAGLFNSRWLLAPFYLGLVLSLVMLLVAFVTELARTLPIVFTMDSEQVILTVLLLIDLSLAGNLVLIVVFSGYENFVSKIDTGDSEDRPSWMGTLDFSGLKMKLIGSIIAISAISLLRAFMTIVQPDVVPDLFETTVDEEVRDGVGERPVAELAQPSAHPNEVLLGDAYVQVARRVGLLEPLDKVDPHVPGEEVQVRVALHQREKRIHHFRSHALLSSSRCFSAVS